MIASMPWPVGIGLGVVAYATMRYGITWLFASSSNPFLSSLGNAAEGGIATILAWGLLGICWIAALASFIAQRQRARLLGAQTGLDSLRAMNWRQLEVLVGEAFRRRGYQVEETGLGGADGGIDLRLRRDGKTTLVQCKQWRSRRVDVKVVREMYGLLAHHGADAIKIVAIGDYTPDAKRFAEGKSIELIHGEALLALVRDVQQALRATARPSLNTAMHKVAAPPTMAASAATPDCPSCGVTMVKRANRRSGEWFWGCANYPTCRATRPA